MLAGGEKQEMKRTHSGLTLHGVGVAGSTEHEALSMPCKKTGHCWVHLIFSSFFVVNFTQITPDQLCSNQFCYQDGQNSGWKTVTVSQLRPSRQFGSFRRGQSEVEDLVLSEWVQRVVETPIRLIQDQESASPTSTSLYTLQTWLLRM